MHHIFLHPTPCKIFLFLSILIKDFFLLPIILSHMNQLQDISHLCFCPVHLVKNVLTQLLFSLGP